MNLLVQIDTKSTKKKKLTQVERGCDYCPAKKYWKRGINRIKGRVTGRKPIAIFAQNPGWDENKKGKELVGKTGKFLWSALKSVGITRHMCDIQNSVRCLVVEKNEFGQLVPVTPIPKDVIHCCSIYTDQAIEKIKGRGKTKIYLMIGQVAAKQVLGKEYTKKTEKIFWSENLQCKVAVVDHPSFFLRGGGTKDRIKQFHDTLKAVADEISNSKKKIPKGLEKFSFLATRDYRVITKDKAAKKVLAKMERYAKKGICISTDLESDSYNIELYKKKKILDFEHNTTNVCLAVGVLAKPGKGYSIILDHPENLKNHALEKVRKRVIAFLTNKYIPKLFHHGSADVKIALKTLGVRIRGYDRGEGGRDSEFMAYFYNPELKAYGLSKLGQEWFPSFTGYKEITMPEAFGGDYKKGRKLGQLHYARVPIKKLGLYNCADCDIAKRIELKTAKRVPWPLLAAYIDASFTYDGMQKNGPLLDYKHVETMEKIFPIRWTKYAKQVRKYSGLKDINPRSNLLAKIIYPKFKLKPIIRIKYGREIEKKSLDKEAVEYHRLHTHGRQKKFFTALQNFRAADAIVTKAINSYKNSALHHAGKLFTTWWLTGTVTGRRRSGGGSQGEEGSGKKKGIVNLQNVDSDPIVQDMLISDRKWYKLVKAWEKEVLEPFKKKHKNWKYLFEWEDKAEDFSERSKKLFEKLYKKHGCKFSWQTRFGDLEIFVVFDHSQLEVRMLAQLSGDKTMLRAFINDEDIHVEVGSEFTGWSKVKIKKDKVIRRIVKAIHFAIIFGKQWKGLWQQLKDEGVKIRPEKVKEMLDSYWDKKPACKELMDGFKEDAEIKGYVKTLLGFRRPVGGENRGSYVFNQAVNSPIQGLAGHLLVLVAALLHRHPNSYKLLKKPRMEVHDSGVWSNKLKRLKATYEKAEKLLAPDVIKVIEKEFGVKWKVPLKVEGTAGFRMGTMVDYDKEMPIEKFISLWCRKAMYRMMLIDKELTTV